MHACPLPQSSVHSLNTIKRSWASLWTHTMQRAALSTDRPLCSGTLLLWAAEAGRYMLTLGFLNDLLLSMASLMPGLYLNSICTWICIQFVCCEIIRNAVSSYRPYRAQFVGTLTYMVSFSSVIKVYQMRYYIIKSWKPLTGCRFKENKTRLKLSLDEWATLKALCFQCWKSDFDQ